VKGATHFYFFFIFQFRIQFYNDFHEDMNIIKWKNRNQVSSHDGWEIALDE